MGIFSEDFLKLLFLPFGEDWKFWWQAGFKGRCLAGSSVNWFLLAAGRTSVPAQTMPCRSSSAAVEIRELDQLLWLPDSLSQRVYLRMSVSVHGRDMSAERIPTCGISFVRLPDSLHDKWEFCWRKTQKTGKWIEYKTGWYFPYLQAHTLYIQIYKPI